MLDDDEENEQEPADDYDEGVREGPAKPQRGYANDSSEEDEEEDDEEAARAVGRANSTISTSLAL